MNGLRGDRVPTFQWSKVQFIIKFDFLMKRAMAMDADYIATGHYARSVYDSNGDPTLLKAVDPTKDQSYVLFGLGPEQLRRLLLPVGWYTKADLRKLAREANLDIADKPDSQDICFIPSGDYRHFLQLHQTESPGDVVDMDGKVLAQHCLLYTSPSPRDRG